MTSNTVAIYWSGTPSPNRSDMEFTKMRLPLRHLSGLSRWAGHGLNLRDHLGFESHLGPLREALAKGGWTDEALERAAGAP